MKLSKIKQYLVVIGIALIGIFFMRITESGISDTTGPGGILCDFENKKVWDISPESGFTLQLSDKHVTEGKNSLEVVFPEGGLPSINTKKLDNNWGEYEALAFDVYNPQEEAIDFRIRLDDTSGKRVNLNRQLKTGWNNIHVTREEISRKIDPRYVKFVVFFLKNPASRYRLFFDNMSLKKSEEAMAEGRETAKDKEESVDVMPIPVRKAAVLSNKEIARQGEIRLPIAKIIKVEDNNPFVSTGIPFATGQLLDARHVAFFDLEGNELSIGAKVLARWPQDKSIRSLLVQFHYPVAKFYQYAIMKWGVPRTRPDLPIIEPDWAKPEGMVIMPARWLCDSLVIGEQMPIGQFFFPLYDQKAEEYFVVVDNAEWSGDLRRDGYYSTPHTYYQLYVRTGELKYFLAARREMLHYRENQIIHEGNHRGRSTVDGKPRYLYMQAMMDDYLFTGDKRTLAVAKEMVEYLEGNFKPKDAYFPKNKTSFWTERKYGAVLLGVVTYYEMTLEDKYLDLATQYVDKLYQTQMEWPSRGGFIHNLYAHDPAEGARLDEYGGSPFMTGLILEGIIKYHQLTGSEKAADSIFRAIDWIINEGLVSSGDAIKYMTSDKYLNYEGEPDLNLLVVHALGYAYKLTGYQNQEYLDVGMKLFERGVEEAYLKKRKHFNQNYRSSGHFLAYIKDGMLKGKKENKKTEPSLTNPQGKNLLHEAFEHSFGRFKARGGTKLKIDRQNSHLNGSVLYAESVMSNSNLGFGFEYDNWVINDNPKIIFSYRIPAGVPINIEVLTVFGDRICLGGTENAKCPAAAITDKEVLISDGNWHDIEIDVQQPVQAMLPKLKNLAGFSFISDGNVNKGDHFWIDEFKIQK
ncbi:MAG: hypothetical protein KAR05_07800 [Candidatus Omnitrophica bacterium]|nr:hypothetical protein [Candidatus Omnitrophota bacterium]